MVEHKVAVIRGDGVGVEVIEEGLKVLQAIAQENDIEWKFSEFPWSSEYYIKNGQMMPSDGLDTLAAFDAIYLGAVGHPDIQDHITLSGLLLPIRRTFDQYVCERPSVLYPGITSPLRD
ncbi:MAG: tartrate dehydrogenase, partial [Chloroflexi bacterium]|nr:tartrate dehydrogenase [Chloroflexota bacterium]